MILRWLWTATNDQWSKTSDSALLYLQVATEMCVCSFALLFAPRVFDTSLCLALLQPWHRRKCSIKESVHFTSWSVIHSCNVGIYMISCFDEEPQTGWRIREIRLTSLAIIGGLSRSIDHATDAYYVRSLQPMHELRLESVHTYAPLRCADHCLNGSIDSKCIDFMVLAQRRVCMNGHLHLKSQSVRRLQ